MRFLNWPTEAINPSRGSDHRRKHIAVGLLDQFGKVFPEISYDLLWESATINSQAWRLGSARYVRVYGGLVRHRDVTKAGLALMLAHETGHHLGGPPQDPDMPWISWQGQADYWAANVGMKKVFGSRAHGMTMRGVREILELHRAFAGSDEEDQPDLCSECRQSIFAAGAAGQVMPDCARMAFAQLCGN